MQQRFLGDESSAQQIFTKSTPELKQTQINHSHVHTKSKLVHQWRGRSEKASQGHKICNGANNLDLGVDGAITTTLTWGWMGLLQPHPQICPLGEKIPLLENFRSDIWKYPKITTEQNNFQNFLRNLLQ